MRASVTGNWLYTFCLIWLRIGKIKKSKWIWCIGSYWLKLLTRDKTLLWCFYMCWFDYMLRFWIKSILSMIKVNKGWFVVCREQVLSAVRYKGWQMARIKPQALLNQSKKKKGPSRISISTIVVCNLVVAVVVLSLVTTYRHWSQRFSFFLSFFPSLFFILELSIC